MHLKVLQNCVSSIGILFKLKISCLADIIELERMDFMHRIEAYTTLSLIFISVMIIL